MSEATGLCVDGHAHLAQHRSDLDGIAMRVRDEPIEILIFLSLFVETGGAAAVVRGGRRHGGGERRTGQCRELKRRVGANGTARVERPDIIDEGVSSDLVINGTVPDSHPPDGNTDQRMESGI